jgi:hypothetical protein
LKQSKTPRSGPSHKSLRRALRTTRDNKVKPSIHRADEVTKATGAEGTRADVAKATAGVEDEEDADAVTKAEAVTATKHGLSPSLHDGIRAMS